MRIGFFISFPFHREILAPIHAQLEPDFPCLFTSDVEQIIAFPAVEDVGFHNLVVVQVHEKIFAAAFFRSQVRFGYFV